MLNRQQLASNTGVSPYCPTHDMSSSDLTCQWAADVCCQLLEPEVQPAPEGVVVGAKHNACTTNGSGGTSSTSTTRAHKHRGNTVSDASPAGADRPFIGWLAFALAAGLHCL